MARKESNKIMARRNGVENDVVAWYSTPGAHGAEMAFWLRLRFVASRGHAHRRRLFSC